MGRRVCIEIEEIEEGLLEADLQPAYGNDSLILKGKECTKKPVYKLIHNKRVAIYCLLIENK